MLIMQPYCDHVKIIQEVFEVDVLDLTWNLSNRKAIAEHDAGQTIYKHQQ